MARKPLTARQFQDKAYDAAIEVDHAIDTNNCPLAIDRLGAAFFFHGRAVGAMAADPSVKTPEFIEMQKANVEIIGSRQDDLSRACGVLQSEFSQQTKRRRGERLHGLSGGGSRRRKASRQKAGGRKYASRDERDAVRFRDSDDPSYFVDDPDSPYYNRMQRYVDKQGSNAVIKRDGHNHWNVIDEFGRVVQRFNSKAQATTFAPRALVINKSLRRWTKGRNKRSAKHVAPMRLTDYEF